MAPPTGGGTQLDLLAGLEHHTHTYPVQDSIRFRSADTGQWTTGWQTWWRWACSAGCAPAAYIRWSHPELAEHMAALHGQGTP